ncbi:hypothetical protein FGO68_gene11815 [Halteria grandinella]|uniref:Uncharacterized protein n=1 Tax=Halteria grandinella TaxID=5974 RepID=A0A8J8NSE8_HALGN|nr:hypothetical protein FGO68_gene11815 [Halteria grandinella]
MKKINMIISVNSFITSATLYLKGYLDWVNELIVVVDRSCDKKAEYRECTEQEQVEDAVLNQAISYHAWVFIRPNQIWHSPNVSRHPSLHLLALSVLSFLQLCLFLYPGKAEHGHKHRPRVLNSISKYVDDKEVETGRDIKGAYELDVFKDVEF